LRETNALIAESRAQLELLREQAGRMIAQLEKMTAVADRLVEGTAAMAEEARRQMALTTKRLAATNRSLEHIVRLAEPLDRGREHPGDAHDHPRERDRGAPETLEREGDDHADAEEGIRRADDAEVLGADGVDAGVVGEQPEPERGPPAEEEAGDGEEHHGD